MRREINEKCLYVFSVFVSPALLAIVLFAQSVQASATYPYAIYGEDSRREVFEEQDPARKLLARSVVAIIDSKDISTNLTGNLKITAGNYGEDYELCMTERFVEQPDAAWCSGFLVADNIVATAGHCSEERGFCKNMKFVFDYMYDSKSRDPLIAKQEDVYNCKKVIDERANFHGSDYALVELDRPVVGRTPLVIATKKPGIKESVFVIGNPVGLPAKFADGKVLSQHSGYYLTDLDAFSGDSGAAVFNSKNEVAGIVARGDDDFVKKGGCYVANPCKDESCRGEDISNPGILRASLRRHLTKKKPTSP